MTITDLRRIIDYLPGDMPVLLVDPETAELYPPCLGARVGTLNPMWVEWLMGFPLGWTDLEASETP